ncbi:DUF4296 domain-containing protein [Mucilaginibacter sp.]|uniref:DUF4296 domain-containing protein n=1 Tax=Mucilaginibacter sp. TaxID=1882438 RepID=UPI0025E137B3|nr:DUF4296 domain-containing protein [Mucilaginibacter sp.]
MHKYIALFFSVSLLLFSCNGDNTPKGIIKHKEMTSLLTEVHLVDGRMSGIFQSADSLTKYGSARYDALFKRYHTDSTTFNKSLNYYASQPAEMSKMYDDILANLKFKTDSLNKAQRKTDSLRRLQEQKVKPQ